jgi:hypothetical protein
MDRVMVYPGAIPLETDILNAEKNAYMGLAKLAAALFGTSALVNGLACTQNSPASLTVLIGPGEFYSLQNVDGTAYSSLAADTTHQIVKQGVLLNTAQLSCPAPGTPGYSINYLIEAEFVETDTNAVVLPYYNASNPAQAYSGPGGAGTANNTLRQDTISLVAKAGVAATTGTQTTPAPDSGYTGLWVVTVANGQSTITSANIAAASGAPFLTETLLAKISTATGDGRYVRQVNFLNQGNTGENGLDYGNAIGGLPSWIVYNGNHTYTLTVPSWMTAIYGRVWGGGGGGGGFSGNNGGGGGSGGGYSEGWITGLTNGQQITITIGVGGAVNSGSGANGGTSSIGAYMSATGGAGCSVGGGPGNGGTGLGGSINLTGGTGVDILVETTGSYYGPGGAAPCGGAGGSGGTGTNGDNGQVPGGGGGSYGILGTGNAGYPAGNGLVIIAW